MPADLPTDRDLVDLVRAAEARATVPVSPDLWSRVAGELPSVAEGVGADVSQARPLPKPTPEDAYQRARGKLRVVHSSITRMRRLAAVAAVLLAVLGVGYWFVAREAARGALVEESTLQRSLDRAALEGPLEVDGRSRPLGRDLYRGVAIEEGNYATDVIRACNPC